ncbi:MAG: ISAs1 family transposase [Chlamydiia bacterium]
MRIDVIELRKDLEEVNDPRRDHLKRYSLTEVLLMASIAIFCGHLGWREMAMFCEEEHDWLKEKLGIQSGVPSHDTFRRIFMMLAPEQLKTLLTAWLVKVDVKAKRPPRQICMDGRKLRGSKWKFSSQDVEMLNAYSAESRTTVSSILIDSDRGELAHVEGLLDSLALEGTLVSEDANFTTYSGRENSDR